MAEEVTSLYPERMSEDLRASGLSPTDIRAKTLTPTEKQATGAPIGGDGYVIPYFGIDGKPIPFYRVKIYDAEIKYRQLADSQNHIYYPPRFSALLMEKGDDLRYIIITEGEKKAAAAVKAGFPAVAVTGVDSWKSRTLLLPKDSSLATKPNGQITIKLPAGVPVKDGDDTLAVGLQDLINLIVKRDIPLIMIYDTDEANGWKFEVQRAAATFGFELRHRGVPLRSIRHAVLKNGNSKTKIGLDDVLLGGAGKEYLHNLIEETLVLNTAFPTHPNIRAYLNKKLQRAQMQRSEQMGVAMAILTDLDSKGQRLRSPDEEALYYFSKGDKTLTKVTFSFQPEHGESPFGRYLYKNYSVGFSDNKIMGWLATQFSGEEPIMNVYPEKVLTWRGDTLYYHINAGTMAKITKDGITLLDNGSDNVLFEADLVDDIPTKEMKSALFYANGEGVSPNWWYEVLQEARIKDSEDDKQRRLLSLLYYVSPLFYRWRGTQLPVEITTGEPGSGKSTLYALRLNILTGRVQLRNAPNDLKDWNASLASSGAMHVTDNVQLTNNDLRQRLSDEICRLVTEASPSIEQRKLFTDTTIVKIPVRCVFAITAVKQPFTNIDIIQRSIITELDKGVSVDLRYDADWEKHQLENKGGRAAWLAHQLVFAHKMLKVINVHWRDRFQAGYRLINVEQLLMMAANVVGWDNSWVPEYLEGSRDSKLGENDWALEGLIAWSTEVRRGNSSLEGTGFSPEDIISWIEGQPQFAGCTVLQNSRSLIRYVQTNKHSVAMLSNILYETHPKHGGYFRIREPQNKGQEPRLL